MTFPFQLRPKRARRSTPDAPNADVSVAEILKKRRQKRRRIALLLLAIPLLLSSPLAISQWRIYRSNLQVTDQNWPELAALGKSDRLLIISPHCDDETLGAGGTIAKARKNGARVRVVFITNGDGSLATQYVQRSNEWKAKLKDEKIADKSANLFQRIAAMRQGETLAACAKLGVAKEDVIFLGYPDGGTRAMWETNWSNQTPFQSKTTGSSRSPYANSFTPNAEYSGGQAVRDLEKIFRQFQPTIVLTTHPEDTHPDHWAAYAYSLAALEKLRLDKSPSTQAWAKRAQLLGFLVHHGIWPTPNGFHPEKNLFPPASLVKSDSRWLIENLTSENVAAKTAALESYPSQLATTPRYLRAFVRQNELFGALDNSEKVNDPPSDSVWSEAWRAADIQSLKMESAAGVLQLQTILAGAPSSRLRYEFSIHVTAHDKIDAWKIVARRSGNNIQAIWTDLSASSSSGNSLDANLISNGFNIQLPREMLGANPKISTILISAATFAGENRLDQTATRTMSFISGLK